MRACRLALAAALALGLCGRAAAEPLRLSNARLAAEFGDCGLTTLSDRDTGVYTIRRDDFSVVLGGTTYDSRSLPAPARTPAPNRVTYSWTAGSFQLDVVYELQPDWRFVSKQIAIRSASPVFRVDEVRVFAAELGDRIDDVYVPKSARPDLGTGDYGAFLRLGPRGLLAAVQNPFLETARDRQSFSIRYRPQIDWRGADGAFKSDRGLLAPYRLTGRRVPERMIPEWSVGTADAPAGADEAEIAAFTECVRAFLLYKPARPLNLFVGWCVNDYQIDVATPEGRAEYKRIIDRAAELGAEYVQYAPSNSALSRREESVDDWSWEHVLWLGLGQKIRKGEWDPSRDLVPPTVGEMLDYARARHVKLLAYVYPVLPFTGNPDWLVTAPDKPDRQYASLGIRSWQDHLIEALVAFHDRLGIGGYSFDHTFLRYDGASRYAQWAGWRRVMEELRRRIPDIVIDGRQAYHLYGPWTWLAGSYPHPTFNDEQPESFAPFPDLHFDRVSADRERYTAFRYRNYEFAPSEIVPGFVTHQTPRNDDTGDMPSIATADRGVVLAPIRARDWDYLGWRYSLLSSIAIAGWNNVLNMIPARDVEEERRFSYDDRRWFRKWIDWTSANKEVLRHTRTILGQPAIGRIDGTSAIAGNRGFVFLFNPNARRLTAELALDDSIGLTASDGASTAPPSRFLLKELYPLEGRLVGKPGARVWTAGDRVSIPMDGQSALVLELSPAAELREPLVFGVPGSAAIARDGVLRLTGVRGEAGTSADVVILLPTRQKIAATRVNGQSVSFSQTGPIVRAPVRFAGAPFRHAQEIGDFNPAPTGRRFSGTVTIPSRVFDQLRARARAWPIPWTAEDLRTTWLAPERLLLYVQIAGPDDGGEARLTIDGERVELRKAYTAIRPEKTTFVDFYADVSRLSSDRPHRIDVELSTLAPGRFQGVFLENVEPEYTETIQPDRIH